MNGYFINFTVYTLAMIGIMLLAVIVYKKLSFMKNAIGKKNSMQVEESLTLSPKKNLYVISVDNERFLIAADTDRTSFLARLGDTPKPSVRKLKRYILPKENSKKETNPLNIIPGINPQEIKQAAAQKQQKIQKSFTQTLQEEKAQQQPVMRNLVTKMQLKRGI